MVNKAFNQAIYSLLHPVSITAIVVLFWNDHWLRMYYPSWWSGKIGDFAWLVFAPLICAAVLAWILPQRARDHQRIVGLLAFSIIGVWFSLAKTVPAVHALTVSAWQAVISGPVSLRLDPTDLLTLPALWLGWQIWQRAKAPSLKKSHFGTVAFALGVVATLASNEPYYSYVNRGVASICVEGNSLVIYLPAGGKYEPDNSGKEPTSYKLITRTQIYTSTDGGQTWQLLKTEQVEGEPKVYGQELNCSPSSTELQDKRTLYRWQPAQAIERSTDNGQHWIVDYDLYQLRQEVRSAYKPSNNFGEVDTKPGPRSGLIDPVTGNVVFAMGWDGVLVRTPAGTWHWASVGGYQLDDLTNIDKVTSTLFFELWEASALIILALTTSAAYIRRHHAHLIRKAILSLGWIGWFLISILGLPDLHHSQDFKIFIIIGEVSLGLLLLGILLTIPALWDFLRNFRRLLLRVLGTGLLVAVLYLFPLILWTQGTIPRYVTAMGFAEFLTVAALIAGYKYLRPMLPVIKPKNAPTNDSHAETADTDQAE